MAGTRTATTTFVLHPRTAHWTCCIRIRNTSASALQVDVLHALDLGLADEGAVRNNDAYVSEYLDLLPVSTPTLGWAGLARQNQPMIGGPHAWLAVACGSGAEAFCTDAVPGGRSGGGGRGEGLRTAVPSTGPLYCARG
jgi:CRISPR-associated protein Csx3